MKDKLDLQSGVLKRVLHALIVLGILFLASCGKSEDDYPLLPGISKDPGTYSDSILYGGMVRDFVYYIPAGFNTQNQYPLLFVLHGGGGDIQSMFDLTQGVFNTLADAEGFVVVYPQAYENNWNDGRNVPDIPSHVQNIDDVGFILRLIRYFDTHIDIDDSRVYSTGISNGGLMSLRLAIEASDTFAAVASVAANMPENLSYLTPLGPVPVAFLLGTDDPILPYNGGVILGDNGTVISAQDSVTYWVNSNQCTTTPQVDWLPDIDTGDNCIVRKLTYTGGLDSSEVILYEVQGGGHTWPGGHQYLPVWLVGETCRDIDACTEIWDFFKQH